MTSSRDQRLQSNRGNGNQKKEKQEDAGERRNSPLISWGMVFIIAIIAAAVGAMAGYQVIGGKPASDVFQLQTWKHMVDLIFG